MDVSIAVGVAAAVAGAFSAVVISRRLNISLAAKAKAESDQVYVQMSQMAWQHAETAHIRVTKLRERDERRDAFERRKWGLALPLLEQCSEYWNAEHPELSVKIKELALIQWTEEQNGGVK